jgi:uncharacterized protein YozE (UPF0346 family)
MTYKAFILDRYKGEDSPRGDLAFDIARDSSFPVENNKETILKHLKSKGACEEAKKVFKSTWNLYQKFTNKE